MPRKPILKTYQCEIEVKIHRIIHTSEYDEQTARDNAREHIQRFINQLPLHATDTVEAQVLKVRRYK